MSGVLSSSHPLENVTLFEIQAGVCGYSFTILLNTDEEITLSWTMNDEWSKGINAVQEVLENPLQNLAEKTKKMNDLLNNIVPYFRCSDEDIVKVYYYLWSLHLMYYTQGDRGMQVQPHTQTAVNNFLGMHRFDAVFQILVGSWVSPAYHDFYANGNVLVSQF